MLKLEKQNTSLFYQNTPGRAAFWMLWGWQNMLSPYLGPRCRYSPSCSEYSRQAIALYGLPKGITMTAARLLRDTGFSERDYPLNIKGLFWDPPGSHW